MRHPFRWTLATLLIPFGVAAPLRASDSPSLEALATASVERLEAVVRIEVLDSQELGKLGRDASLAYRLLKGKTTFSYASPDKLNLRNRILHAVVNGRRQFLHAPPLINKRKTESDDSVTRRFSLLNVGILVKAGLEQAQTRRLRSETLGGRPCEVFEVVFEWDSAASYVFWVDVERRMLLKREWRTKEGELKASFVVSKSSEPAPGFWAPSEVEVRTEKGALAARIVVEEMKVNSPQDDALFEIP